MPLLRLKDKIIVNNCLLLHPSLVNLWAVQSIKGRYLEGLASLQIASPCLAPSAQPPLLKDHHQTLVPFFSQYCLYWLFRHSFNIFRNESFHFPSRFGASICHYHCYPLELESCTFGTHFVSLMRLSHKR